jgi:hypothetical protein
MDSKAKKLEKTVDLFEIALHSSGSPLHALLWLLWLQSYALSIELLRPSYSS